MVIGIPARSAHIGVNTSGRCDLFVGTGTYNEANPLEMAIDSDMLGQAMMSTQNTCTVTAKLRPLMNMAPPPTPARNSKGISKPAVEGVRKDPAR